MNILVVHEPVPADARPDEQDTQVQAQAVASALKSKGHAVSTLAVALDFGALVAEVQKNPELVVFNLTESFAGHVQGAWLVPAMIELLGNACTGNSAAALRDTLDKVQVKAGLLRAGIKAPRNWSGDEDSGTKWIVKSYWEHASVGIDSGSIVSGFEVQTLMDQKTAEFGGEWFAEQFIEGREFNISLLDTLDGPQVLPPAEIEFSGLPAGVPHIVGYDAKWEEHSHAFHHTPRRFAFPESDQDLLTGMKKICLQIHTQFGLAGYTRVDFRVDTEGTPWVLEINTNPCLSPDAGFAAAAAKAGMDYAELVDTLVQTASNSKQCVRVES